MPYTTGCTRSETTLARSVSRDRLALWCGGTIGTRAPTAFHKTNSNLSLIARDSLMKTVTLSIPTRGVMCLRATMPCCKKYIGLCICDAGTSTEQFPSSPEAAATAATRAVAVADVLCTTCCTYFQFVTPQTIIHELCLIGYDVGVVRRSCKHEEF